LGRLRGVATEGATIGSEIEDVRIAVGSVAPVPIRLTEVEQMLKGKSIDPGLVQLARKMASAAIEPIDDIRSTAKYRSAVTGNLVAEFIEQLGQCGIEKIA
jgi:carbon-monoxide dehydrogenase medium subunit